MNKFVEIPANKQSLAQRKPLFGIGINNANYQTRISINNTRYQCPYYVRWKHMIERCYCAKYQEKHPTYIGCTVTKEWLTFSNFKKWIIKQDWKGNHLDKDILTQGNKIYSPEFCIFVSPEINVLLTDSKSSRGKYPVGVTIENKTKRFRARVNINGKTISLGSFFTKDQAHAVYLKAKYAHIKQIALQQSEPLRSALLNYKIK